MQIAKCLATLVFASTVCAQDFIHFKFDSGCTNEVINYATGPQSLGSNGTLVTSSVISPWTGGMFGGGLAGGSITAPIYYNRVTTNWNPSTLNINGNLTIAWFMRQRAGSTMGTTVNYLMGAPSGGFRLFTNGAAGTGLIQREIVPSGGNSSARDFVLPAATFNVQAAAAAGWVHVAMVFDATAQTADWYINGVSVFQLTNIPGAAISLAGPFTLGAYSTSLSATSSGASNYDLDDFLMSLRAYSPAEVLALASAPQGGAGRYLSGSSSQCGSLAFGTTGGRPGLGNAGFALTVTPTAPSFYSLLFGFNRCSYAGAIPLPFDGGLLSPVAAGCTVLADNLTSIGGLALSGTATQPFPIANDTNFLGINFFGQAVAIDLTSFALSASNGVAVSTGL